MYFIRVLFVIGILIIGLSYFYLFIYDYLFEPDPIEIELAEGSLLSFKLNIELDCVYTIGIRFTDKKQTTDNIRHIFGDKLTKIQLDALLNIKITNSKGVDKLVINDFGSKQANIQYGPNPIGFVVDYLYLEQGRYSVTIKTNHISEKYSDFDSSFFVEMNRKVKCL